MTVYAFHIFDRKGKTLFTKRYSGKPQAQEDADFVAEQRKLIFGMLFSLRELIGSLTPEDSSSGMLTLGCLSDTRLPRPQPITVLVPALNSVRTGAGTCHCYETISGLRIALYTNNNPVMNKIGDRAAGVTSKTSFQTALKHIYSELWVECVVRSPLYRPEDIQVDPIPLDGRDVNTGNKFDIKSTNFEEKLDAYLQSMPWFR
ncbi:hypothetical protein THAOC_35048 [Thalassiosira oceanica]|uniref:Trafficking protein particle complex subunit n=1 Tax=Thalassiosira oceanica TaxID=159749 RepID=K0R3Z5_THAOC|nr:hypothetical protein THAOC_35048 [Thalassiosira oceanica]|eukprot:EJK46289.1 hypothetical protein THAOC_35048 [Thalassiosira oceanica]